MCVPQSLAVLQALSTVGQIMTEKDSDQQQERRMQQQAETSRRQAKEERRRGQLASNRRKVETQNMLARQRNSLAAAGIDAESGSAKDILSTTQKTNEMDRKEDLRLSEDRAESYDRRADKTLEDLSYRRRRNKRAFGERILDGSTLLTRRHSNFNKRGLLRY